jgi:hypothetical protein
MVERGDVKNPLFFIKFAIMILIEEKEYNPIKFIGWSEAKFVSVYSPFLKNPKEAYGRIREAIAQNDKVKPNGVIAEGVKKPKPKKANTRLK